MKLAEALVQRADLQKRIEQMRQRLLQSVVTQEGEEPPEKPDLLLAETSRMIEELGQLVATINRANLATTVKSGISLTEALARRDALALHYSVLSQVADRAGERPNRYSRSEIKMLATVDVGQIRTQMDELAQRRRELDTAIQEANWATELPE